METGIIISEKNVQVVAQSAPQLYADCKGSHDKCLAAGQALMERIEATGGKLDDNLDKECALYIERVKKTLKKMNDLRSPLTKMLDEFKSVFTAMENEVNVTKDSLPATIQSFRNAYAAEKRAEEERRRQEEYRRAMAERERNQYVLDTEEKYKACYTEIVSRAISELDALNASLTLDNFDEVAGKMRDFDTSLPNLWDKGFSPVHRPLSLSDDDCKKIMNETRARLEARFREEYALEVEEYASSLYDRLPSKKAELEAIANADKEDAERRRAEIAEKEAEEAQRKEAERKERAEAEAEAARQASEMNDLFGQSAAGVPSYVPKTSVRKRVNILGPEGYAKIFAFWWSRVGYNLSMDELAKVFKTQVTYCEKAANDKTNPVFVESRLVEYTDEVKAK